MTNGTSNIKFGDGKIIRNVKNVNIDKNFDLKVMDVEENLIGIDNIIDHGFQILINEKNAIIFNQAPIKLMINISRSQDGLFRIPITNLLDINENINIIFI